MEMIEYTTASRMAEVYRTQTQRLRAAMLEVQEACDNIAAVMVGEAGRDYYFRVTCQHRGQTADRDTIEKQMKVAAWRSIIDHVGIKKLMSSKRREELDAALDERRANTNADNFPDISEETIIGVLQGYASSADDLLSESIREEYDYFKPQLRSDYKTNQKSVDNAKLERKIIKEYAVQRWSKCWSVSHYVEPHLIALDNIFHLLDGKGTVKGYRGPLIDAIGGCGDAGAGSTDYFEFRCFKNRNLHLTFKRLDLLEKFNAICGRAWLPAKAS